MEMHQVRYFLAVCETLNFTRAAEHCHVAQPSLTRAIHKLEDELGGLLFRRERNRTHLTDLGRLMRPHLRSVYESALAAQAEAEDFQKLEKAFLRLGVMSTIGPARLVGFIGRLRREIPSLDLQLHEAPGERLRDDLMQGEVDVALIGLPNYPERMNAIGLYDERYVIAFPKGHRFEDMASVTLAELDAEDYLQRIHCEFMDHFNQLGIPKPFAVNRRYSSEREDWIQAMVLAGMGCSIMPEYLPVLSGIGTRVIIDPAVKRTISLAHVAGRRFSPTVAAFMRLAQRFDWDR
ncbi:MAG: LysR family transcriptional regulator [Alphaproteobacteria bacterium]|nr:LysR family transcriptional regulator [Alphaproteobacteria bacterium]